MAREVLVFNKKLNTLNTLSLKKFNKYRYKTIAYGNFPVSTVRILPACVHVLTGSVRPFTGNCPHSYRF